MPIGDAQLRFDGAVVLVTGGGRGVGRGIATGFLAAGATVVICGRSEPEDPPRCGGRTAHFHACDVRDAAAVAKLVEEICDVYGRIDLLVNNAGGSPLAAAATASPRFAERIVQLNLLAPIYCAQAANRFMQAQEDGGVIINISSVAATRPAPGTAFYGAAKAGLLSLTQSLAIEWGPKVRVNALIAGQMATEQAEQHYGGQDGIRRVAAMLPLKRMGESADVAAACLFLASPLAAYISGAMLAVHGGGEPPADLYAMKSVEPSA